MKALLFPLLFLLLACSEDNIEKHDNSQLENEFVNAVDISSYPEISLSNPKFYNESGVEENFIQQLKNNGVNTIRLRLWVNPSDLHSGFEEVKTFSDQLKSMGFKIWISLHYSDTWADPAQQITPISWQNLNFTELSIKVKEYTKNVILEINPDYIQIGNEINNGFLHPLGNIHNKPQQFKDLLALAIDTVRENSTSTQIIIHFAGVNNSLWFFQQIENLDYDIIGLSYYPIWHDKNLLNLKEHLNQLENNFNKKILIAETAYPFTLDWNDHTNNIVGENQQLILPDFPATPLGQYNFLAEIKSIIQQTPNGLGLCYWGAELVAWKGQDAVDASSWENQALFDFQNKVLPGIKIFAEN